MNLVNDHVARQESLHRASDGHGNDSRRESAIFFAWRIPATS